jgi:ribose transport system permease protein
MVAFVGAFHPIFLHVTSISDLLQQASSYGIIALRTVFVLSMGEIDLSAGGNMGVSAVCCALLTRGGMNPCLGGLLGLGVGTLLGLANAVVANGSASTGRRAVK